MSSLLFEFINPMSAETDSDAAVKSEPADLKEIDDSSEQSKCGEIFALYTGNFILICGYCHNKYENMLDFGSHVNEKHEDRMTVINSHYKSQHQMSSVTPIAKVEESVHCNVLEKDDEDSLHSFENVNNIKSDNDLFENGKCTVKSKTGPDKSPKFACDHCGQSYKHKGNLRNHQLKNNCKRALEPVPRPELSCLLCNKEFKNSSQFNRHNQRFHMSFKNSHEDFTAGTIVKEEAIESHCDNLTGDHQSINDTLNELGNNLLNNPALVDQCSASNELEAFKTECDRNDSASSESETETKSRRKSTLQQFSCESCDRVFRSKQARAYHVSRHHDESLQAGQHTENTQYRCKYCNKEFPMKSQCVEHEGTHVGEKRFICWYCPHTFRTNYGRKRHMRVHTGERPFKCSECPKAFPHMVQLDYHIRKHKNLREFSCQTCGKAFFRKFELSLHERRHTGFRPLVCEDCGKTFNVMSELNEHRKRHTDIKDWKCEVCGKCFYSKWTLKDHMAGHSGETPFGCEVCGRKFSRAKALKKHKKLHSDVKAYVCNICGKAYAQDSGLYAHKKTHGIRNRHAEVHNVNKNV